MAAGILGTSSGRVGTLRTLAYLRVNETVSPYGFTVANLSSNIAQTVNRLGMCDHKNDCLAIFVGVNVGGIQVQQVVVGAEGRSRSNVIPGDVNSLSFSRTEREVMRIVYGTGFPPGPADISLKV